MTRSLEMEGLGFCRRPLGRLAVLLHCRNMREGQIAFPWTFAASLLTDMGLSKCLPRRGNSWPRGRGIFSPVARTIGRSVARVRLLGHCRVGTLPRRLQFGHALGFFPQALRVAPWRSILQWSLLPERSGLRLRREGQGAV